jgi:protein-L-isoaspartate(D-aspartate) O-methyltransferase
VLRETGVKVITGDGRDGHAAGAPYDRIVVTASADEIPRAWRDQLSGGGLLEVPLRLRTSAGLQLIPTLRRDDGILRSASVICGGFMPLRAAPEDRSPYWPTLDVTRSSGPDATVLFSLGGESLRKLSRRGARHLTAAICSTPTTRRLGIRAQTKPLLLYLMLRGPARRLVGAFDGREFLGGVVGRGATGIALLSGWPTTSRMLVYGEPEAADELASLVRDWSELGRPGESELEVSVHFRNGGSAIRSRWRGR